MIKTVFTNNNLLQPETIFINESNSKSIISSSAIAECAVLPKIQYYLIKL